MCSRVGVSFSNNLHTDQMTAGGSEFIACEKGVLDRGICHEHVHNFGKNYASFTSERLQ